MRDSLNILDKNSKTKNLKPTPYEMRKVFLKIICCEKNKAIILFGASVKLAITPKIIILSNTIQLPPIVRNVIKHEKTF